MPTDTSSHGYPPLPRPRWRRATAALGGACLILALLAIAGWVVVLAVTDRFLTTQFFYWSNAALVFAAAALALTGALLRRLGAARTGRTVPAIVGLSLLALGGREFGVFRWIGGLADPAPARGSALRLVHWNMSVFEAPPGVDLGQRLSAAGTPDIALVSMQNNTRLWEQISAAMRAAPGDKVYFVNAGDEKVFSRFPVTGTRTFHIPFKGENVPEVPTIPSWLRRGLGRFFRTMQLHNRSTVDIEDATIVGLTFDTTALTGSLTHAWFVDMPSNPIAGRYDMAQRVARRGGELVAQKALPRPDFIVGDFNIPLGSASLSAYAPGFAKASDTAGLCRLATWPRPRQVLQLDHILVSPGWRATDYRLLDPGASEHMAQTAILWPEKAP